MEEKERYISKKISKYHLFTETLYKLKDTKSKFFVVLESIEDANKIKIFLSQQDKRIKELEEENKVGEFWHSAYKGKQLEYDQIYAELRKSYEENHQLKQSQKQLAIKVLEKVKNYFGGEEYDDDSDGWIITNRNVVEYIDNQIKELKGE